MSKKEDISIEDNTTEVNNLKVNNSMSKHFSIVLNIPIGDTRFKDINSFFDFVVSEVSYHNDFFFWSLYHDKDLDVNGSLKTPHVHLVLKSPVRKRKSTIINYLSHILNIPEEVISVRFSPDLLHSISYLTHLNELDKYQYDKDDIKTNDWTTLDNAYSDIRKGLSIDYLVGLCQSYDYNAIQVFLTLGIDYSNKYRNLIESICKYGVKYKNVK